MFVKPVDRDVYMYETFGCIFASAFILSIISNLSLTHVNKQKISFSTSQTHGEQGETVKENNQVHSYVVCQDASCQVGHQCVLRRRFCLSKEFLYEVTTANHPPSIIGIAF